MLPIILISSTLLVLSTTHSFTSVSAHTRIVCADVKFDSAGKFASCAGGVETPQKHWELKDPDNMKETKQPYFNIKTMVPADKMAKVKAGQTVYVAWESNRHPGSKHGVHFFRDPVANPWTSQALPNWSQWSSFHNTQEEDNKDWKTIPNAIASFDFRHPIKYEPGVKWSVSGPTTCEQYTAGGASALAKFMSGVKIDITETQLCFGAVKLPTDWKDGVQRVKYQWYNHRNKENFACVIHYKVGAAGGGAEAGKPVSTGADLEKNKKAAKDAAKSGAGTEDKKDDKKEKKDKKEEDDTKEEKKDKKKDGDKKEKDGDKKEDKKDGDKKEDKKKDEKKDDKKKDEKKKDDKKKDEKKKDDKKKDDADSDAPSDPQPGAATGGKCIVKTSAGNYDVSKFAPTHDTPDLEDACKAGKDISKVAFEVSGMASHKDLLKLMQPFIKAGLIVKV